MTKPIGRRLPELSLMNILLFFFVLFIHVSGSAVTSYTPGTFSHAAVYLPWAIAGVAVYGFIFLSGLKCCLNIDQKFHLGKFYLGRARSILLPYLCWALIYYLIGLWQSNGSFSVAALGNALLTGNAAVHLYFIIIILQFYLLMPLWRWCVKKVHPAIALPIALCITLLFWVRFNAVLAAFGLPEFPYTDRLCFSYLFFWLGGCYVGAYYPKFKEGIKAHPWLCSGAFLAAAALYLYVALTNTIGQRYLPIHVETHLLFLTTAILFFYMLCLKAQTLYQAKGVALLDRSSFAIYLSHILIMDMVANRLLNLWALQSIGLNFALRAILTVGITLPLCMGYTALKQHFLKKRG